jgi:hypothetical protein
MNISSTTLDRRAKCFKLEDGTKLKFTTMLDIDGNVTKSTAACIVAICQSGNLLWAIDVRLFEDARLARTGPSNIFVNSVNRRAKHFRRMDGTTLPFIAMLNAKCEATDNPDECALAAFKVSTNGLMHGFDLRMFGDRSQEITH